MQYLMSTHWAVRGLLAIVLSVGSLGASEPMYEGLGSHSRTVTTDAPEAQRYFNQGLAFLHGFNHGAAIRSFEEAARLDPECAMAHWGIAYASGPHINYPLVPPDSAARAWKHLQLARQHATSGTPIEQGLIDALAHRYTPPENNPPPEERAPLDQAYADAMRKLFRQYPNDADVGAFFAESLMNLRPWDQWTPEGEAQPGTEEVLATLEAVLERDIDHPLANHLTIHAVEASKHPERAAAAAARLRDLQPGLAHNVHMPSHIDIRLGRWQRAIEANEKAVEADRKYREIVGKPEGFINLYVAHNRHMLAFAAMMTGQRDLALGHIRAMTDGFPDSFLSDYAFVAEPYCAMPDEVMVRFGLWDEILALPQVDRDKMPFTAAFRHAARAVAHAANGDPAAARSEQRAFLDAAARVPDDRILGNNTAADVFAIVTPMVEGEILAGEGKVDEAVSQLREAISLEDQLRYDEPPGWMIPVRHALGAVLSKHGRHAEAEQVYRDDLERLPHNGWSLYGLSQSLASQGKTAEATAAKAEFEQIWANADIEIRSSCLCQPGT